jgi:hypothetical protein
MNGEHPSTGAPGTRYGGGVWVGNGGSLTIKDSNMEYNGCTNWGAQLVADGLNYTVSLTDSTFVCSPRVTAQVFILQRGCQ